MEFGLRKSIQAIASTCTGSGVGKFPPDPVYPPMLSPFCTAQVTADWARNHLLTICPEAPLQMIDEVTTLVETLFGGSHPGYQKADLEYHDLEHTQFATQCFIDLARGRVQHRHTPVFSPRDFTLGYAAIMLHDIGYLKTTGDVGGTGAKYTTNHVVRSCAMTDVFLSQLGCNASEIEGIKNAIRCTGITSKIDQISFNSDVERLTGCMVATADYLGQMADPRYPDKLPGLFAELKESSDFNGVPADQRIFRTLKDLKSKTGGFWSAFVLPKLKGEYEGVYQSLSLPDGINPYMQAVDRNLAIIAEQVSAA